MAVLLMASVAVVCVATKTACMMYQMSFAAVSVVMLPNVAVTVAAWVACRRSAGKVPPCAPSVGLEA